MVTKVVTVRHTRIAPVHLVVVNIVIMPVMIRADAVAKNSLGPMSVIGMRLGAQRRRQQQR